MNEGRRAATFIDAKMFGELHESFAASLDIIETARSLFPSDAFVCHHNTYLCSLYFRKNGYSDVRWTNGFYKTSNVGKLVHHSWLQVDVDGQTAIVFETDPFQLSVGA